MTFDPYGPTDDLANIVIDSAALANDGDDRYGPNAPSFLIALRSGVSTRMPERRVLTVQDSNNFPNNVGQSVEQQVEAGLTV